MQGSANEGRLWTRLWSSWYSCQRSWDFFLPLANRNPQSNFEHRVILSKGMILLIVFIINFYIVAIFQWMSLEKGRWLRNYLNKDTGSGLKNGHKTYLRDWMKWNYWINDWLHTRLKTGKNEYSSKCKT